MERLPCKEKRLSRRDFSVKKLLNAAIPIAVLSRVVTPLHLRFSAGYALDVASVSKRLA
jgi:hypothetical protein